MELGDCEDGRGLLLVKVCADDWGWFPLGDSLCGAGGKFVRCDLSGRPDPGDWAIAA